MDFPTYPWILPQRTPLGVYSQSHFGCNPDILATETNWSTKSGYRPSSAYTAMLVAFEWTPRARLHNLRCNIDRSMTGQPMRKD